MRRRPQPSIEPATERHSVGRRHRLQWMLLSLFVLMGVGIYWGVPTYWVYRGESALAAGRYDEADVFFQSAESWPSQRSMAILGRVRVARVSGEPTRAIALLTSARSRGVTAEQAKLERTLLDIQCGGDDASMDRVPGLLVQYPDRGSEIMEAVVNRDLSHGDHELALHHVNQWIEATPENPRAVCYKAEILATNHAMDDAEALFRDAIQRDPSLSRARIGLAKLLKYAGRYQESIERFETEIASDPQNVKLRLLRCDALLQMQRNDEAILALQEVLEIEHSNFPARHSLATQYAERGEFTRVIETLEPLMNEFSEDASINYLLASAYSQLGDTGRAETHLQHHMDGRKRLDELTTLGRTLVGDSVDQALLVAISRDYLKYQWDVAEPWIARAIENSPHSAAAFSLMAEFQRKKGDVGKSAQYEQAALAAR